MLLAVVFPSVCCRCYQNFTRSDSDSTHFGNLHVVVPRYVLFVLVKENDDKLIFLHTVGDVHNSGVVYDLERMNLFVRLVA